MKMENYNDRKKYYHLNGSIELEQYLLNDKLHRTDGPAEICYNENGGAEKEFYWLNGEYLNVSSLEEFKQYQKTLILK